MSFYVEMLTQILLEAGAPVVIGGEEVEEVIRKMAEMRCCQALKEIQDVLKDDTLSDETCFRRIERIVEIYEALGSGAGGRHDFG